jgi:hypothetical protein
LTTRWTKSDAWEGEDVLRIAVCSGEAAVPRDIHGGLRFSGKSIAIYFSLWKTFPLWNLGKNLPRLMVNKTGSIVDANHSSAFAIVLEAQHGSILWT